MQALGSFLTADTKGRFGSSHASLPELLPFAATLRLECIGNSDALYHNRLLKVSARIPSWLRPITGRLPPGLPVSGAYTALIIARVSSEVAVESIAL
jgi:hypothetical protein